jgi:hypothetical protein
MQNADELIYKIIKRYLCAMQHSMWLTTKGQNVALQEIMNNFPGLVRNWLIDGLEMVDHMRTVCSRAGHIADHDSECTRPHRLKAESVWSILSQCLVCSSFRIDAHHLGHENVRWSFLLGLIRKREGVWVLTIKKKMFSRSGVRSERKIAAA